tara:strand:+ start:432 stop:632 length:201 start_codon:yes stop_codon:yes gene_type:complete
MDANGDCILPCEINVLPEPLPKLLTLGIGSVVAGYCLATMMTDETVCRADGQGPCRWGDQRSGVTF